MKETKYSYAEHTNYILFFNDEWQVLVSYSYF